MVRTTGWFLNALPGAALLCFMQTASAVDEDFPSLTRRLQAEKPQFAQRQMNLLAERYDLADRPAGGAAMSRGKPLQEGVRVKLPPACPGKSSQPCRPGTSGKGSSGQPAFFRCRIPTTKRVE